VCSYGYIDIILFAKKHIATIITAPNIFSINVGVNLKEPINEPKEPPARTATINGIYGITAPKKN